MEVNFIWEFIYLFINIIYIRYGFDKIKKMFLFLQVFDFNKLVNKDRLYINYM